MLRRAYARQEILADNISSCSNCARHQPCSWNRPFSTSLLRSSRDDDARYCYYYYLYNAHLVSPTNKITLHEIHEFMMTNHDDDDDKECLASVNQKLFTRQFFFLNFVQHYWFDWLRIFSGICCLKIEPIIL